MSDNLTANLIKGIGRASRERPAPCEIGLFKRLKLRLAIRRDKRLGAIDVVDEEYASSPLLSKLERECLHASALGWSRLEEDTVQVMDALSNDNREYLQCLAQAEESQAEGRRVWDQTAASYPAAGASDQTRAARAKRAADAAAAPHLARSAAARERAREVYERACSEHGLMLYRQRYDLACLHDLAAAETYGTLASYALSVVGINKKPLPPKMGGSRASFDACHPRLAIEDGV